MEEAASEIKDRYGDNSKMDHNVTGSEGVDDINVAKDGVDLGPFIKTDCTFYFYERQWFACMC